MRYHAYCKAFEKDLEVVATYTRDGRIEPVYRDAFPAFAEVLKGRIASKHQNVVLITGRTGSGKSTVAINLARCINPKWQLEPNYIYSTEDLKAKLGKYGDGRSRRRVDPVSLFDECAISLNSKNALKKDDKTMVALFDTMRSLGWTSLLCIPNIDNLNKSVRESHIDYMIMCPNRSPVPGYDPRGFAEIYRHVYRDWGKSYYRLEAVTLTKRLPPVTQTEYDKIKLQHQLKLLKDFSEGDI